MLGDRGDKTARNLVRVRAGHHPGECAVAFTAAIDTRRLQELRAITDCSNSFAMLVRFGDEMHGITIGE